MLRECVWCSRRFVARPNTSHNFYVLVSAGIAICWNCSDLYDEAEVKLHFGPIRGRMDEDQVVTQNGHVLPLAVHRWLKPRFPWRKWTGYVVDSYGKTWTLKQRHDHVKLKPIGV